MDYQKLILNIVTIHLIATITPGANFTIVVKNTLTYSRKFGFFTVLGIMSGNFIYIVLSLTGVSLLLSSSPFISNVFKIMGSGYLFYLGLKMLFAKNKTASVADNNNGMVKYRNGFKIGLIVSLTNPSGLVFWTSLFASFIPPNTPLSINTIMIAIMLVNGLIWYFSVVYFFSRSRIQKMYYRSQKYLNKIFGFIIFYLALKILIAGKT